MTDLRTRALERRERYETFETDSMPTPERINALHIPGSYSILVLPQMKRYLNRKKLLDLDGVLEAPTTVARDYLAVKGFKAARLRGETKDKIWQVIDRAPAFPMWAEPTQCDDGFYLDIRKCFFSIMHKAGWNVRYCPGKFVLVGDIPLDFPFPEIPVARNSLVTCGAHREMYAISPPHWNMVRLTNFNPLLNSSLNALIRDLLHAIGYEAQSAGAIYVNTDGYIAPNYKTAKQVGQIIEDYGLTFSIKGRGRVRIYGRGNYQIGERKTKWVGKQKETSIHALKEIESATWLQNRMASLSAMDGHLNLPSDVL
jgi:hypothetical protein